MQFLSTCPEGFLVDKDKLILKFIGRGAGLRIARTILKKKNKVRVINVSHVKAYYKAIIME